MAAWLCPQCDESYPAHSLFNLCPECGTSTRVKAHDKPDIDMDEGERRVNRRDSHAKFEEWLKKNGRDGDDPAPIKVKMMYDGATMGEVEFALGLARAVEDRYTAVAIGEIWVCHADR